LQQACYTTKIIQWDPTQVKNGSKVLPKTALDKAFRLLHRTKSSREDFKLSAPGLRAFSEQSLAFQVKYLLTNIALLKKVIAEPPDEDDDPIDHDIVAASPAAEEEEDVAESTEQAPRASLPGAASDISSYIEVNVVGPTHVHEPASTSASSFPVIGSRVEGQLTNLPGVWFFGTVVGTVTEEQYQVRFDDAAKNHKPKTVLRKNMRRVKEKPVDQRDPYAAGDFVWGMYKGHGAAYLRPPTAMNPLWYTATVEAVTADTHGNLMYTIRYDDDHFVETLHSVYVRPMLDKVLTL
jgi:hypothetical protein